MSIAQSSWIMSNRTPSFPSADSLRRIADAPPGLRVSLYLPLPERPGFADLRAIATTFQGAVRDVRSRLLALGASEKPVEDIVARLEAHSPEPASLPQGSRGVALLLDPQELYRYAIQVEVQREVSIGRSFRVRPLLRSSALECTFRVLVLSEQSVVLYEGNSHSLRRIESAEVPSNLEEALGHELDEPSLQAHIKDAAPGLAFHGHGGAPRGRTVDRQRFHRVVARTVNRHWNDRRDPLVLAASAAHQGRFRKLAQLPGLLEEGVVSSAERMSSTELLDRALPLVRTGQEQGERAREAELPAALAHGAALAHLPAIASAAAASRVAHLWVDAEHRVPGHVDRESGGLVEAFADEDALDELALLTLQSGGEVGVRQGLDQTAPGGAIALLR